METQRFKITCSGFVLISLMFILVCCNSRAKREPVVTERLEIEKAGQGISNDLMNEEIEELLKNWPPPSLIPTLLESSGTPYNETLTLGLDRMDSYRSTSQKTALNLGVYTADAAYFCVYGKTQEVINYMDHSRSLADHLGVTSAFDITKMEEFKENLHDSEKIGVMLDNSIRNTTEYLRTQERTKVAILVLTGGFVEGLHLSTKIPIKNSNEVSPEVIKLIEEQREPLNTIIEMLKMVEPDPGTKEIINGLEELRLVYDKQDYGSGITSERITMIRENVEKIRAQITS